MDERKESCPWKGVHEDMREDIRVIRKDVKSLLKFKWQIMGGTAVVTFITVTLIALMGAMK